MADWYGQYRTSYFAVKDVEKFSEWVALFDNASIVEGDGGTKTFAILGSDGDIPERYNEEEDPDMENPIHMLDEISQHLAEGHVAIFMCVGWEKMRYLTGNATAINWEGKMKSVDLSFIYELSASLGPMHTKAEY